MYLRIRRRFVGLTCSHVVGIYGSNQSMEPLLCSFALPLLFSLLFSTMHHLSRTLKHNGMPNLAIPYAPSRSSLRRAASDALSLRSCLTLGCGGCPYVSVCLDNARRGPGDDSVKGLIQCTHVPARIVDLARGKRHGSSALYVCMRRIPDHVHRPPVTLFTAHVLASVTVSAGGSLLSSFPTRQAISPTYPALLSTFLYLVTSLIGLRETHTRRS